MLFDQLLTINPSYYCYNCCSLATAGDRGEYCLGTASASDQLASDWFQPFANPKIIGCLNIIIFLFRGSLILSRLSFRPLTTFFILRIWQSYSYHFWKRVSRSATQTDPNLLSYRILCSAWLSDLDVSLGPLSTLKNNYTLTFLMVDRELNPKVSFEYFLKSIKHDVPRFSLPLQTS